MERTNPNNIAARQHLHVRCAIFARVYCMTVARSELTWFIEGRTVIHAAIKPAVDCLALRQIADWIADTCKSTN